MGEGGHRIQKFHGPDGRRFQCHWAQGQVGPYSPRGEPKNLPFQSLLRPKLEPASRHIELGGEFSPQNSHLTGLPDS